MGVRSGGPRVAELAFRVFDRTFHPEWFSARAHRRYTQAGWEADIRIVEGGHVFLWSCGPVRVAEVLTGPETELPEPGLLYRSAVRSERSASLRPGPSVEYQTCFAAERIDAEVFAHLSDELTADEGRGSLFIRHGASSRLAPAPLSRIYVEARPRGLSVQAFHTFPDERAIVRTQSLFEVRASQTT
jgi:hypothetical protein